MHPETTTPTSVSSTTGKPTCVNLTAWFLATYAILFTVLSLIITINHSSHPSMEIEISSMSVSPIIVYSSSVTGNWSIDLLARNMYKDKTIYYDAMQVSVFYGNEFLSTSNVVVNGTAGPKNETSVHASLVATSAVVKDWAAACMDEDLRHGSLRFGVAVRGSVRVGGGGRPVRRMLRVDCNDAKVENFKDATDGAWLGGSSKCDVKDA